jgi:predicted GTPase
LPALWPAQLGALAATINNSAAEIVVSATPIDLARLVPIDKRMIRARYDYAEDSAPGLASFVDAFLARHSGGSRVG